MLKEKLYQKNLFVLPFSSLKRRGYQRKIFFTKESLSL